MDIFHAQRHSCINHCPSCTSSFHVATTIKALDCVSQVVVMEAKENVNFTEPIGLVTIKPYNVIFEGILNFTFAILEGNNDGKFMLNNVTGEITVLSVLDHEENPDYVLVVNVSSANSHSLSAIIAVMVS